MTDLHAAVLDAVTRALDFELPGCQPADLRDHAAGLVAIAELHRVRVEALLAWIHENAPGKEWSLAEWRGWCTIYGPDPEHRQ